MKRTKEEKIAYAKKHPARLEKKEFPEHGEVLGLALRAFRGGRVRSEKEIIQSMSRKGNCYDNSPMENFFSLMKKEMFYGHEWEFKTYQDLRKAVDSYILWYNRDRIKKKLNWMSPVEYREACFQPGVL